MQKFLTETKFGATKRLSAVATAAVLGLSLVFAPAGANAAANNGRSPRASTVNLIPTVTGLIVTNGQILASGNVSAIVRGVTNTVPFSGVPVTLALAADQSTAGTCPVLNLSLAPINLDLLGLVVTTSPICLDITAQSGGGLLGDLLCNVGNLLNNGGSVSNILGGVGVGALPGLTQAQVTQLLGVVQDLLNGALGSLLNSVLTGVSHGTHQHECSVLHLSLGPVDLTLLGLNVALDNCNGGPVVVDITAMNGQGNLLGNLLCGLAGNGQNVLGNTLQQLLGSIFSGL